MNLSTLTHHGMLTCCCFLCRNCPRLKTLELPSSVLYPSDAVEAVLAIARATEAVAEAAVNPDFEELVQALPSLVIRFI